MALSDSMKGIASELLLKLGHNVTVRSNQGTSTYDTTTATYTPNYVNTVVRGHAESYKSREIIGLIQAGDMKVLLENAGVEPTLQDKIIVGSVEYSIINVEPELMGNTDTGEPVAITYIVQARR